MSLATRFSNSFCLPKLHTVCNGLLIQVYPATPLNPPVSLDDALTLIGRDDGCSIQVAEDSISRKHAQIEKHLGYYSIRDLRSTNGTFVNEIKVDEVILKPGDRIRLGNRIYKFITDDGVESQYHEVIFKMMTTDGLTQVYNKRFLLDSLDRILAQSRRGDQAFCVMMMDLDKFKLINDTYGHLAGDAVLVEFAKRATSVLRGGEILARYGGEEFCMLCAPASLEQASTAAERIRSTVAAEPVLFNNISIPMTVSIGIACYDDRSELTGQELIGKADQMLYRAKENGRNQVQF